MEKREIETLVIRSVQSVADELGKTLTADINTEIYGSGDFDSIALVSLIADLEDQLSELTGRDLILATERAMSRRNSPFKDVSSLVAYVSELMNENA